MTTNFRSQNEKPTCGVFYEEGRSEFGDRDEPRRAFAAGFVSGQAEKVYLGACRAAMICADPDDVEWFCSMVSAVADRYGLTVDVVKPSGSPLEAPELWIHRSSTTIGQWLQYPVDSEDWHKFRAMDCGIPRHEIDTAFHQRPC